ncbi:HD-GYP domain-containing protein [Denitromonas iodatirespirans]|uniref:Response regulator n=1 Tax=Denitromonas iodatirespirans TaxID=2795389 RepID=A0A944DBC7_DENI1|nr:HD domain-containing phosphohydrolase [Denitromonas iodatirespirans]MBT0961307.1 response regulator [Denitromonas iodatirespirans]
MTPPIDRSPRLLLVDDEPTNLQVLRHILQQDYRLLYAKDGHRALELAAGERPDLILLDVMMPGIDGIETCRQLKAAPATAGIPVIFVTALADIENETEGFDAGAVDYITKPVSAPIVRARVRTHLSLVRVDELADTRLQIVQRLGRAAEFKDNETGLHVIRMSHYARILALAAGLSERDADDILNAAPMHDVGKIGIPDAILRKEGPLDDDEWRVMRSHCEIGAQIIGDHNSGLLAMARRIALTHHEKWDGSGYPAGLVGDAIPIEGRIVAIADVFDALTSERPYKAAWPVDKALDALRNGAGKHFDPALIDHFIAHLPAILEIKARWAEHPDDAGAPAPAPTSPAFS